MNQLIDTLLYRYHHADVSDFGVMALGAIVLCWFVSKYFND